jgi:hypothetical protein
VVVEMKDEKNDAMTELIFVDGGTRNGDEWFKLQKHTDTFGGTG